FDFIFTAGFDCAFDGRIAKRTILWMNTTLKGCVIEGSLGIKLKQSARAVRHPKLVGGGVHLPHPEMSCFGCENDSLLEFVQSLFLFHQFRDVQPRSDVPGECSLCVIAWDALV